MPPPRVTQGHAHMTHARVHARAHARKPAVTHCAPQHATRSTLHALRSAQHAARNRRSYSVMGAMVSGTNANIAKFGKFEGVAAAVGAPRARL